LGPVTTPKNEGKTSHSVPEEGTKTSGRIRGSNERLMMVELKHRFKDCSLSCRNYAVVFWRPKPLYLSGNFTRPENTYRPDSVAPTMLGENEVHVGFFKH
jgi:hypothetical protein